MIQHQKLTDDLEEVLFVKFFGSIPASMLSLWEITLDGYVCGEHWGELLPELYEYRPLWVSVLLIVFVSVTKLGLLTIIAGIFTTYALRTAEDDCVFVMQCFAEEYMLEADLDGDSAISWEEFRGQLHHPFLYEFVPDIAGNPVKAKLVFDQVDKEGLEQCSLDELVRLLASRAKC